MSASLVLGRNQDIKMASKVGETVVKEHVADMWIPAFASSASSRPPFSCSIKMVHLWL